MLFDTTPSLHLQFMKFVLIDLQTSDSNTLQHLAIPRGLLATLLLAGSAEQNYTRGSTAVDTPTRTLPAVEQLFLFALRSTETCMLAILAMNERTVPWAGGRELERVVIVLPSASRFPAKSLSCTCQSSFTP